MNRFIKIFILLLLVNLTTSIKSSAQTTDALGSFTPYSMFGLGDISQQGTAYNKGMGGIGIGVTDNKYINYLNPASISNRDTLSFMLDFGISQKNFYNKDEKARSAYNTFNMHNFVFSFPIYKKSAFIIGISPFSDKGYKFESTETDDESVAEFGDVKYQKYGTGGIYQAFAGASMMLTKRISLGAQMIYYFGSIDMHNNALFNSAVDNKSIYAGWDCKVKSFAGKFGVQYNQPLKDKNKSITLGATYRMSSNLRGQYVNFAYTSVGDTIINKRYENMILRVASELGAGVSYRERDKLMVGVDYSFQDWNKSAFIPTPGVDFQPVSSHSVKAGFEYIPNRYDVRYYMKTVTYRGGLYYEKSFINIGGHQINSLGLTLGMSLPIYRLNNAISVAVDMGQRGKVANNLVRERYIMFNVNINIHDIWFQKFRYD